jgi:hypothetical protein
MMTNKLFIRRAIIGGRQALLLSAVLGMAPLLAVDVQAQDHAGHSHGGQTNVPAKLVEMVRTATLPFIDVNAATAANYQAFLGCVSGPDQGAMGVHYVNGDLVADGQIDVNHPEALIYEPVAGALRLVGVEFIVDAATWLKSHTGAPVLEGQVFQLVTSPNRFGLNTFFELHVWAWRDNPNGSFVDWNTRVSCEGQ